MAISAEKAEALVRSWACLDKFPREPEAQSRLAKTLLRVARDNEHAKRIANTFTEICPRPSEIERVGAALLPKTDALGEMRREYVAEVERAVRDGDCEAVEYYEQQQPKIVAQVRRKLGLEAA